MTEDKSIRDRTVNSESLTLGDTSVRDWIWNSEVTDCKIRIVHAACVGMNCSRFTRCYFEFAKQANELHCHSCQLIDCAFIGRLFDCYIGGRGYDHTTCTLEPQIRSCDFSRCTMHICSFMYAEAATLKVPLWPHITVIQPFENSDDWNKIPFPKSFQSLQRTLARDVAGNAASIVNWHWFAKKAGERKELPDSLREILQSKSYIRM